ncbi:MAG: sulfotransferase [Proteobacteria bacterium]|nr:sulfotransferase [Pseudomonadota bacterium]
MTQDADIRRIAQAAAAALARRDFAAALALGRQWAAMRPAFRRAGELGAGEAWRNLGNLEGDASDVDAAIAAYRAAVRVNDSDAAAHALLAQMLERRHALAEARTHAVRALSFNPNSDIARLALAQVALREKSLAEAEGVALPLAEDCGASKTNRALAWGMVGEARDRLDRAHDAFLAFQSANVLLTELHGRLLRDSHLPYHPDGVRRMLALLDEHATAPPSSFQTPAPIFLVGFPRSGTTLLDQILSSHSRLCCMEEKEVFAESVADILEGHTPLNQLDVEARRAAYWARVRTPLGGRLLVDKLPLNIIFLPLIARVFPDAKIIFALRDPRDGRTWNARRGR